MGLEQELVDLSRRRTRLVSDVERIRGREEAARKNLEAVEEKCRQKRIDPEKIDETITRMETALRKGVASLGENLREAEASLEAFESTNEHTEDEER
jgi:chromosome segregation ATPase